MVPQAQGIPRCFSKETKMNDTTDTAQLFLEIAKRHMPSVETLETRNRDALEPPRVCRRLQLPNRMEPL
jgi:hypothetical protein